MGPGSGILHFVQNDNLAKPLALADWRDYFALFSGCHFPRLPATHNPLGSSGREFGGALVSHAVVFGEYILSMNRADTQLAKWLAERLKTLAACPRTPENDEKLRRITQLMGELGEDRPGAF
jgi:hypothetical protein